MTMDNDSGFFEDDDIFFAEETGEESSPHISGQTWKMLVIDDEEEVHSITQFSLDDYLYQAQPLQIINAYSASEAKDILQQHDDIALILLDVVMETDHAGLELVHYIREELQNHLVRIVLRTGQPGQAPEKEVIIKYDINDYKHKTELTDDKLFTLVTASLRNYIDLTTIESYRLNLEHKVEERTQELADKNQELLELNQALRYLNQEKNEFLHIAAHDLKNPLFAIQSLANLIATDSAQLKTERIIDFGRTIENSAHEMFNLIKRLMDVNAIEAGKMQFNLEVFNLVDNLKSAINGYQERAKLKNIILKIDLPQKIEQYHIFLDKHAFSEIIGNIVSNAIKYSPAGKQVDLIVNQKDQQVCIEVKDQGPGLSTEDQKHLFEKFGRLTPRPTANESSSGLGLFIVKNLVCAMKGEVWCESELDVGTSFFISFPLANDMSADTSQALYITSPMSRAEVLQRSFQSVRETESRLVQFLDAMPVGVAVVDHEGKLYYVNQKAQDLLGKGIVPNTTYKNFSEIYQLYHAGSEKLYDPAHYPITPALLEGISSSVDDVEIHHDNETIPLEVWATPIYDEKQSISYAIAVFQDIGKRKKSEVEREKFTSELVQLKKAYERFVPREFLNLLDKQHMIDVQLGDQVAKEMTVMFSDIRGFTSLSEDMEPQEIFDFINNYLGQMEPIILKHNGFIDKYIGDAIMALFPTTVDDAVRGSISMLQTLNQYNNLLQRAGYPAIKIGIGLNTGPLILGTVGGQNRMDGTVISDAVNISARIENLTKKYGSPLLITAQSYIKLKNIMEYHIRVIDSVQVKGKSNKVVVYEIFDADPPAMIELKLQTLRDFEQGFMCYHNNNIAKARSYFEKVNAINPADQATLVYLDRCLEKS
ncbi:adenylate/guanylate cyclase domain-containing protein [Candidatus Albibeggiatoa sp. nov. NOAA]|uniref:ATP-binding protein n=1 Tax=Candidatus Albibeggiatoa sp. nov. NOAA TaxID=3162724 RepID=UPI0033028F80|nr:ATP-binding protein [Thiotrichaceae bacterium]